MVIMSLLRISVNPFFVPCRPFKRVGLTFSSRGRPYWSEPRGRDEKNAVF